MPTTTTAVTTGWISQSQRHGLRPATMIATATNVAQPTCTEGIAANWFSKWSLVGVVL